jgi:DNA polymerase III delta prime subunit
MAGTAFLDAMRHAHADRVAGHTAQPSKILKAIPALTVREQLGAILLDMTDLHLADLKHGTTVLVHDDPNVVDCLSDAVRRLYGDALTLLRTGTHDITYDQCANHGLPVVVTCWDRLGVHPQDIVLLADRDVDVGDVGHASVIARLTEAVTGTSVHLSEIDAGRFGCEALIRCVQLGSTTENCERRLRAWLDEAARVGGAVAQTEKTKSMPKLALPVSPGKASSSVVRRLSEMTGFGEAGVWGLNLAADLRDYREGRLAWNDVDRGVLLSGPPGCGKTTFASALALECGVDLVPTTYTEWSSAGGALGDSMSKGMTKLFDRWREKASTGPFVLFIDEIDTIGRRGGNGHNDSWFTSVINAWLAFLDGAVPRDGIVVLAATNHPDRVDPALLRPGRLDRHIELPMPDVDALAGLIRAHLGADAVLTDAEVTEAARAVRGRSPAEVQQLAREARRLARWCGRRVCASDLTDAVAKLRRGRDRDADEQTAVHEAGHAVAAVVLGVDRLIAVDLDAAKTTMSMRPYSTREVVEGRLVVCLAARAAEELMFGAPTNGAGQDLHDATGLAMELHGTWGFGALGLVSIPREVAIHDRPLREAVRRTLDEAYAKALDLVRTQRSAIERVADALVARRFLDAGEVRALVAGPMPTLVPAARSATAPSSRGGRAPAPGGARGST